MANGIVYKITAAFRSDPPFLQQAGGDLTFEREDSIDAAVYAEFLIAYSQIDI